MDLNIQSHLDSITEKLRLCFGLSGSLCSSPGDPVTTAFLVSQLPFPLRDRKGRVKNGLIGNFLVFRPEGTPFEDGE